MSQQSRGCRIYRPGISTVFPLRPHQDRAGGHVLAGLDAAVRPADLDLIDLVRLPQAEVDARSWWRGSCRRRRASGPAFYRRP